MDASQVHDQHTTDRLVENLELTGEFTVQVIVGARYRAERKGRERAPGGLIHAVVMDAQRWLAAARRR
jgi:hypothetical protein